MVQSHQRTRQRVHFQLINQQELAGSRHLFQRAVRNQRRLQSSLSWITSEEGLMMDYYGIEGDYYTVDDKGICDKDRKGRAGTFQICTAIISYSGHLPILLFERHTEPVPDPTSNRGIEICTDACIW